MDKLMIAILKLNYEVHANGEEIQSSRHVQIASKNDDIISPKFFFIL